MCVLPLFYEIPGTRWNNVASGMEEIAPEILQIRVGFGTVRQPARNHWLKT
jgi:hypothetical protein